MDKLSQRKNMMDEAKKRVKSINFGDPITNICAGDTNPTRLSYFVEFVTDSYRNKYGITHNNYYAKCTNGKGKFWNVGIEVIYPGHIDYKTASKMFMPIRDILW